MAPHTATVATIAAGPMTNAEQAAMVEAHHKPSRHGPPPHCLYDMPRLASSRTRTGPRTTAHLPREPRQAVVHMGASGHTDPGLFDHCCL